MINEPLYILLAEGGTAVSESLKSQISQAGWRCDIVPDGDSVISAVQENHYDLIITDLEMPGLCGSNLIQKLRQKSPAQPIIVVSSRPSVNEALPVLKEGATGYFKRPVDFGYLQHVIEQILETARQKRDGKSRSLIRHANSQFASYSFSSVEIADMKFPLVILENLLEAGIIDQGTKLKIELAFQEALANSLEHGNLELDSSWKDEYDDQGIDKFSLMKKMRLSDPRYGQRKLTVSTNYTKESLEIIIKDDGLGFLDSEECVRSSSDLLKLSCHGRGMFLIAESMDRFSYRERGTELVMIKDF